MNAHCDDTFNALRPCSFESGLLLGLYFETTQFFARNDYSHKLNKHILIIVTLEKDIKANSPQSLQAIQKWGELSQSNESICRLSTKICNEILTVESFQRAIKISSKIVKFLCFVQHSQFPIPSISSLKINLFDNTVSSTYRYVNNKGRALCILFLKGPTQQQKYYFCRFLPSVE